MSRRPERIAELLRLEVAQALQQEVTDPRVELVTLTRIDVAPDLSHAVVFWSTVRARDEQELKDVAKGLASAAGFLRHQLARRLSLRRMPALRFQHDPSLALGGRTLEVLGGLKDGEKS